MDAGAVNQQSLGKPLTWALKGEFTGTPLMRSRMSVSKDEVSIHLSPGAAVLPSQLGLCQDCL